MLLYIKGDRRDAIAAAQRRGLQVIESRPFSATISIVEVDATDAEVTRISQWLDTTRSDWKPYIKGTLLFFETSIPGQGNR
jgi:hypothetical protein